VSAPFVTLTTSPAAAIVTPADVRAHLRLDEAESDDTINGWIATATRQAENWCGRRLSAGAYVANFDGFPCGNYGLRIPHSPITAISSVAYLDGDGAEATWDAENYVVGTLDDAFSPHIYLAPGASWPTTYCRPDAVRIAFTAAAPPEARSAILLLIGALDAVRENTIISTAPLVSTRAAEHLLTPYQIKFV
jgi:uncharacterized phiE125 gp8 family phage protein